MKKTLSADQWREFDRYGVVRLGTLVEDDELGFLQRRIDDIMLGTADVDYDRIAMQVDNFEDTTRPGPQSNGFKGARLDYRKIQNLELDAAFLSYMQRTLFRHICERVYGTGADIGCFRAMFMNKPARSGTPLLWHQDRWRSLSMDPQVTVWLALDPATVANGCVRLIRGSHHKGVINPESGSGFLTEEQAQDHCSPHLAEPLELDAGEAALLHNWTLHSSGVNQTDVPRRAFSVCYLDARTRSSNGREFPVIFGNGALRASEAPVIER